jgi:hypothetical protein
MIVDDMSSRLPQKMVKKYADELFRLRSIFNEWHSSGRSDRDCNLILYLMRRAWRPIYAELKHRYVKLWGPKASFSYFFPDHTHNAIWDRVTDRLKGNP